MKIVYFTNTYLNKSGLEKRSLIISQAGKLRSQYLFNIFLRCNKNKEIVFLSQAPGTAGGVRSTIKSKSNSKNVTEYYLGYLGTGVLQFVTSVFATIIWILRNVSSEDIIVTYNFMPRYSVPIIITKPLKKYKLIVEFEELYGLMDIPYSSIYRRLENYGIKNAQGFITPSYCIANKIRKYTKEAIDIVICQGYFNNKNKSNEYPTTKGRLTILYSGTLDEKRGLTNLITLMSYVNDFADLIITGKGPLSHIFDNPRQNSGNVKYYGYLSSFEYAQLLEKVHICINPTPKTSKFAKYSFPSKIVYYLSNSKIVLSTKLDVIVKSKYCDMVIFFDEDNPQQFRDVLMDIQKNFDTLQDGAKHFPQKLKRIQNTESTDIYKLFQGIH